MKRGGVIAVAGILVAWSATADGPPSIAGRWKTTNGPITIAPDGAGRYTLAFDKLPGKVTATLTGDRLTGRWWNVATAQPCAAESEGTKNWGGFQVSFYGPPAIVKPAFQGIWTFCLVPPAEPQSGVIEGTNFAGEKAE